MQSAFVGALVAGTTELRAGAGSMHAPLTSRVRAAVPASRHSRSPSSACSCPVLLSAAYDGHALRAGFKTSWAALPWRSRVFRRVLRAAGSRWSHRPTGRLLLCAFASSVRGRAEATLMHGAQIAQGSATWCTRRRRRPALSRADGLQPRRASSLRCAAPACSAALAGRAFWGWTRSSSTPQRRTASRATSPKSWRRTLRLPRAAARTATP